MKKKRIAAVRQQVAAAGTSRTQHVVRPSVCSPASLSPINYQYHAMEDLVNQAERLTAEIAGTSAFPRVERNLKQLAETGQELWSRTSAESRLSRQTAHVSASILLAGRGYDLTKVTQQLESLSSRKQLLDAEGADQRSDDGGAADAAAVATRCPGPPPSSRF